MEQQPQLDYGKLAEPPLLMDRAGLGSRLSAQVIDIIFVFMLSASLTVLFSLLTRPDMPPVNGSRIPISWQILIATSLAYFIALESCYGQTVGKAFVGLKVVRAAGLRCNLVGAIIRNLVLPLDWVIGLVPMLLSSQRRRLGDLIAGTVVVKIPVQSTNWMLAGIGGTLLAGIPLSGLVYSLLANGLGLVLAVASPLALISGFALASLIPIYAHGIFGEARFTVSISSPLRFLERVSHVFAESSYRLRLRTAEWLVYAIDAPSGFLRGRGWDRRIAIRLGDNTATVFCPKIEEASLRRQLHA
jgi:uncharacterized RDD family membrane protein YckC